MHFLNYETLKELHLCVDRKGGITLGLGIQV